MTYYIESIGKGGGTSSGSWHIHFTYTRKDSTGRAYMACGSSSHFTKKAMTDWLHKIKSEHNVIMPTKGITL